MQRLLDDLLRLAKLQSGAATLDKQWYSLQEIVDSALRQLPNEPVASRLRLDLPADAIWIEVDALLLERALINLLDNAFKHTPPGTQVAFRATVDGKAVCIEVVDEGPGLSAEALEQVFEPFRLALPDAGKDLRLALVKRIVQMHGGRIEARPHQPQGTVFTMCLPRGTPPAEDDLP
jgi:two-component system sensor histidine kinase KdpD